MKHSIALILCCLALPQLDASGQSDPSPAFIKAFYTRLPFDDHGFTGKYTDIVVELPQRGQFIFSREFGYQPCWLPLGGRQHSVARLIPRQGDGPDERPDNHNIACNAAIVRRRRRVSPSTGVTHWTSRSRRSPTSARLTTRPAIPAVLRRLRG